MRLPVTLGFLLALLVGFVAIGIIVAGLASAPATVPTYSPYSPPIALTTPSPTPSPAPTPSPTLPGTTPSGIGSSASPGTGVGQRAPDFVLPHLAGGEISSADSRGKPLWVNFMATWCPQCQDELPMMMSLSNDLGDSMDLIVVDVNESEELVSDFMIDLGVDLPVALDEDGSAQREWGALALPVHYFLDGDGVVQDFVFGGAPRDVFEAAILKVVPDAEFDD